MIMTVRKAKKIFKGMKDHLHPTKPAYTKIKWHHKGQYFLLDSLHGQRVKSLL
jgi:hypothetical protein